MFNLEIKNNPLKTKADVEEAFRQLTDPLKPFFSKGSANFHIGNTSASYPDTVADFEGFSRILWGLAPLTCGGANSELWETYIQGIKSGTDPLNEEYWGDVIDYDQRLVEMAAFGLALVLAPEKIWEPLNEKEKKNLKNWLLQINSHKVWGCNWVLFIMMVNLGLKAVGEDYDEEKMNWALDQIEEYYIGDSWYADGANGHCDYYVPFAIHFYSLFYAKVMEKDDPVRSKLYKDRAAVFAKEFIHWFAKDGSALPYGRSLTYRFAQSAFWSALAFAEVDVFSLGVVKGLVLRNLRWWFKQSIFNSDGTLTVGYAYPNLIMAENYNSPGSPYWAFKTFLILALSDNHPFWTAKEEELPELDKLFVEQKPHFVFCRSEKNNTVMTFNTGHIATNDHSHTSAKYEKFVYSNTFGFSVPKAEWGIGQGAFDSMLALSEEDNIYRVKRLCEEYKIENNNIYMRWKPWADVQVETRIICGNPWHIRIHMINTSRTIDTAEGGFALGLHEADYNGSKCEFIKPENGVVAGNTHGISGIINLYGQRTVETVFPNVNTNIIHSRTVIPTLTGKLKPGKHCLIAAVYGSSNIEELKGIDKTIPYVEQKYGKINIISGESKEIIYSLEV